MKIEKINDKQIRCTLSRKDLDDRKLKISELAYGSDKAKALFRELMQQAASELGFEIDDLPLMIEAIPVAGESLILIVTKVDDPEELDTRFSKFTRTPDSDDGDPSGGSLESIRNSITSEDILNCFQRFTEELSRITESHASAAAKNNENSEQEPNINEIYRIFLFNSLETVIKVSSIILPYYHNGYSDLYRTPSGDRYYLVIRPCQETNDNFNRVCGILSEYGTAAKSSYATLAFLDEHLENVITLNAVDVLAKL